jgi:hypothetical protein
MTPEERKKFEAIERHKEEIKEEMRAKAEYIKKMQQ